MRRRPLRCGKGLNAGSEADPAPSVARIHYSAELAITADKLRLTVAARLSFGEPLRAILWTVAVQVSLYRSADHRKARNRRRRDRGTAAAALTALWHLPAAPSYIAVRGFIVRAPTFNRRSPRMLPASDLTEILANLAALNLQPSTAAAVLGALAPLLRTAETPPAVLEPQPSRRPRSSKRARRGRRKRKYKRQAPSEARDRALAALRANRRMHLRRRLPKSPS